MNHNEPIIFGRNGNLQVDEENCTAGEGGKEDEHRQVSKETNPTKQASLKVKPTQQVSLKEKSRTESENFILASRI